jgi:hypothetical protein
MEQRGMQTTMSTSSQLFLEQDGEECSAGDELLGSAAVVTAVMGQMEQRALQVTMSISSQLFLEQDVDQVRSPAAASLVHHLLL